MSTTLVAEQEIRVGESIVIEGASPTPPFAVAFEDDGDTGYFYAIDTTRPDNPIMDALHIYNTEDIADRHVPSTVQIVWSRDGQKAALRINDQAHAIFDFAAKRGYCRTGFPPPADDTWTKHSHAWNDEAERLFD